MTPTTLRFGAFAAAACLFGAPAPAQAQEAPGCSLAAIAKAAKAGMHQSSARLCTPRRADAVCEPVRRLYPWIKQTLQELGIERGPQGLKREERLKLVHALSRKGFGVTEVYRPSTERDDDRLLDTNPHPRTDIELCTDHQLVFYVGRWPWRRMPAQPLGDATVAAALRTLASAGFRPQVRCSGTAPLPASPDDLKVALQWPEPGTLLARKLSMHRFDAQDQQPVLFAACPGEVVKSVEYVDRWREGPERVTTETRWLAPAAAGGALAAVGLLLVRSQHQAPAGPVAPPDARIDPAPLRVRVRPDPETVSGRPASEA